ncbi:MAG: hypothetical protein ACUVX9_01495 [Anaerolineae bacterium]
MAHLPMDDAVTLFEDNKAHTWNGLSQTLRQHKGKTDGISDNLIDMMMPIVDQMAATNQPYPDSAQMLDQQLNQALAKMPAMRH